jgi:hypothetical protein
MIRHKILPDNIVCNVVNHSNFHIWEIWICIFRKKYQAINRYNRYKPLILYILQLVIIRSSYWQS